MREDNLAMFKDTYAILEQGYYKVDGVKVGLKLSRSEMEEIKVYLPEDVWKMEQDTCFAHVHAHNRVTISCVNADSYTYARKLTEEADLSSGGNHLPVLVLNLANAVHPGGGVRRGAKAQEEDLCRKSSLLMSLESPAARKYYEYNAGLHTQMGSDAIMITPQVEIIKDENGRLLDDSVIVAVMTCAAPRLLEGMEGLTEKEYRDMVYQRIEGMLKVAANLGYQTVILGAFGCGAFANDAKVVSDLFYKAMKEFDYDGMKLEDFFSRLDFAVMDHSKDQYNFRQFSRNFNNFYRDEGNEKGSEHRRNGQKQAEYTFFWKIDEKNGEFSNWYASPFVIDDFEYLFVEQYMMAQKAKLFHDTKRYTQILKATTPWECKELGKQVTPFHPREWNAVKFETVKAGNRAKYEQNPDLKAKLLATGDSIMAEASPLDKVWGIGVDAKTAAGMSPEKWPGENLLGKGLMELREEFRKEEN